MATAPASEFSPSPAPQGTVRGWLSRMLAVIYGLVMFEVIIMISPFAFYF